MGRSVSVLHGRTVWSESPVHVVWQVTDRVYLVKDQRMTGTVTEVFDGKTGRGCRVHWDGTPENVGSWHPDGDLECWTLPEVR